MHSSRSRHLPPAEDRGASSRPSTSAVSGPAIEPSSRDLFALSAVTLGMQLTTETHKLYSCTRPVLRSDGPIPILVFGKGPFYLAYQIYLFAALLALVAFVVRQAIVSSGSLRAQALLMLSSFAFPISAFSAYAWRLTPWGMSLTPLSSR